LLSNFNPNAVGAVNDPSNDGGLDIPNGMGSYIGPGLNTSISIFDNSNASSLVGLFGPVGQKVILTYTYVGYEAAYTNTAFNSSNTAGAYLFANQAPPTGTAPGTSTSMVVQLGANGLIPFAFLSNGGGSYSSSNGSAINGGSIGSNVELAFATVGSSIAFAFLEDIGANCPGSGCSGDQDFDDMVVEIQLNTLSLGTTSVTPLPAALPLFVGGLGIIGFLTRRRKQANTTV
jgi:hypothetical protein